MEEVEKAWHIINGLVTGMNIRDERWKPATDWLAANRPKKLEGKLPIMMGGKFDCQECGTNHGLFHCPIKRPNAIALAPPPQRPACEKDVPGG